MSIQKKPPVLAVCNNCQAELQITALPLSKIRVRMPDGVMLRMQYFTCKHCNKSYRIALYSPLTIALDNEVKRYERAYRMFKKEADRNEAIARRTQFQNEMRALQDRYKDTAYQWAEKSLDMYVPDTIPEEGEDHENQAQ